MKRWEIAKLLIGPGIALLIATVGWILADRYNDTQKAITSRQINAEIEISRVNAALRYMDTLSELSEANVVKQRQILAIVAPVLPPLIAFQLVIKQLPHDTVGLDTLLAKYHTTANRYLVTALEIPFQEMSQTISNIQKPSNFSEEVTEREATAMALLQYLRIRGLIDDLFYFLISQEYDNTTFLANTLLLYYYEYREFLRSNVGNSVQSPYLRMRARDEFEALMSTTRLSLVAKRGIAFATSIVFDTKYTSDSDSFAKYAAEYFWDPFDVSRGGTPSEGSMESYIYSNVFFYNYPPGKDSWLRRLDLVESASESLREKILSIDFKDLDIDSIRLMLYAYTQSPTVAGTSAYLIPNDVLRVTRAVLDWANTPRKRQQLSMELGSMGGRLLFRNLLHHCIDCTNEMSDEEVQSGCHSARIFSQNMANWYERYHADDWHIPNFFDEVFVEFPDMAEKYDYRAWGVGYSSSSGSSKRCVGLRIS